MKSHRRLLALMAVFVVSLVPAAASADWSGLQDISNRGNPNFDVDVAVAPDGSAEVAWIREIRTGTFSSRNAVQVRHYAADGTPGQIRTLSAPVSDGSPDESSPAVAIDDQGRSVVVWERDGDIRLLRIGADGAPSPDGIQTISQANGQLNEPDVAITPAGAAVATWTRFVNATNDQNEIVARQIPAGTSTPAAGEITVASFTDVDSDNGDFFQFYDGPNIATAPNGDSVISWLLFECSCSGPISSTFTVQARRLAANGTPGTLHDLSATSTAQNEADPLVAIDDNANATVLYSNPSAAEVFARRVLANDTLGPARQLSDPSRNGFPYDVDVAPTGEATAVWTDYDPSDFIDVGQFARLAPDGTVAQAATQFSGTEEPDYAAVAVDDADNSTLFWSAYDFGPGAYIGHGRRVSPAGALDPNTQTLGSTSVLNELTADAGGSTALGAWAIEDDETEGVDDPFIQGVFFRPAAGGGGNNGGGTQTGTTPAPPVSNAERCAALRQKLKQTKKKYRRKNLKRKIRSVC